MKYLLFGLAAVLIISGFYFFLTNRSSNQAVTTEKSDQELASASQEFEGVAEFEDEPAPIDNQEAEPIAYPTNLTLTLRDGTQVALADFQGQKAVVLDFWASWCHNCQRNMPNVSAFYDKYRDEVEIIAVNLDESTDKIDKYYQEYAISYPTAVDPSAKRAALEFGIRYTNTHVLITKDGILLDPILGDLTEAKVQELVEAY